MLFRSRPVQFVPEMRSFVFDFAPCFLFVSADSLYRKCGCNIFTHTTQIRKTGQCTSNAHTHPHCMHAQDCADRSNDERTSQTAHTRTTMTELTEHACTHRIVLTSATMNRTTTYSHACTLRIALTPPMCVQDRAHVGDDERREVQHLLQLLPHRLHPRPRLP
eukprot:580180-Rhodomonas_salina.2